MLTKAHQLMTPKEYLLTLLHVLEKLIENLETADSISSDENSSKLLKDCLIAVDNSDLLIDEKTFVMVVMSIYDQV